MNITFTIDPEKIENLNGKEKVEAFFKYLKKVSKNKTPLILQGEKTTDCWECSVTECSIPVSKFYSIKLPAIDDNNAEGTKLNIQLTEDILSQFTIGTKFTFKETVIEIKRDNLKVKCAYKATATSILEQISDYQELLDRNAGNSKKLTICESSEIVKLFKELRNSPEAYIFVDKGSVTLIKDTIFFRTKNTENYTSEDSEALYINMYLANTVTSILDYTAKVDLVIGEYNTFVTGYDENGTVIVKNVSAVFDKEEAENPTDEDLAGISPKLTEAKTIDLDLESCVAELEKQKSVISVFTESRMEAKLLKNGSGASFGFEKSVTKGENAAVIVNIGDVENTEPDINEFTDYSVTLPLDLLKNVFSGSLNLKIVYDADADTAVAFEVGDSKILSGKYI